MPHSAEAVARKIADDTYDKWWNLKCHHKEWEYSECVQECLVPMFADALTTFAAQQVSATWEEAAEKMLSWSCDFVWDSDQQSVVEIIANEFRRRAKEEKG